MPNFQPSSVINFTGSIAGSPASNVASNAFTSFNDTISFRDPVIPNGTLNAFSPNSGTATQDGNVVVNIDYTYTNGARVADYYIIFYKQGGGTVSPSNPCIILNPSSGVASSARINVVPGSPYTFAFSSARVTKDGVKASSPQNQTARTMIAGNYTANIAGISAASIASAGKVVSATIDKQAINYSVTGAATPTSINITATTQNITTPYYTFYRDIGAGFVEIQARSTDNSLSAYSGIPPVNTAYQFKVEAHEGNVATVAASDFVTVYGLASGSNALTTIISNESHSIPADSTGSPTSYAGSGTTIRLYEGSTELTYVASAPAAGQWTVIASPTNITTGSLTATSGYLTVGNHSAITSSTASIDYNISGTRQNGTAIPSFKRIQSLVKTNAGTAGAGGSPAQYVIVTGDQAFRYSSDSTTAVPSQITLSAELYGGLTTYNWQYYNTTNSAWSPASVTTQTYTVSPATAGFTGNSFRVRCVSGAFTDEITLVKLFDGTNAKVGYLTNEAFVSTTNSSGGSPVYDGGNGVFKVFNGITDISTGAGTSYGILSGSGTPSPIASVTRNGLTLTIGASTGIYSPSGAAWSTNSESFTLRATTSAANGSVVIDKVFNIAKSRAGSPGATGNPGTNVATVYLYQRTSTTTSPTMPADAITYTFSSGNVNSPNTGWSSTIPSFTGTNPYLWVTLATASNSASTDIINSNEWQAAKLLSQNGTDGSPGAAGFSTAVLTAYIRSAFAPSTNPGTIVYTFSTSAWTPTNGWSKTIPSANGLPLWAVSATAFSTASTDTVNSGDWSTPTKVLIDPTSAIGGNLTTQSENLAAWTFGSASVSPGILYLDGSTQFWKVYESTTASAYHDIVGPTPFASISVGDRLTVSANVMKGERSKMAMYLATDPWSPNNWPLATFDLSAGSVSYGALSIADAGIFEVGNIGASKVYRIYITTVPATVATSTYPLFRTKLEDNSELYASASPGSGFYATRVQLSKGYLAEYLKTDTTTIQNNALVGDAFTGTTELRVKSAPSNNATIGTITSAATIDGNSVITVPITYTQSPAGVLADGVIVYYKEGLTGANSPANDHKGFSLDTTDNNTIRNVQFTLKPNQAYNFSVRAYRRSEGGRKYTAFSGVSTHTSTAGNYTGNVNNISASTVTTNAADGATAFTGTAKYRTAGAPTNLVSPTGITAPTNSNATKTIRVSWAPYTQGTNQADVIGLFYRRDNLVPTYTDSCVVMNVNVNTPAYYDLQGVNPADQYSFGIAAGRRTESGIEWGLINTTYGTSTFSLFGPDVSVYNGGVYPGGTLSPWTDFTPDGQSTWRVADTSTTQFGGTNLTSTSTTISATERWMVEGWVKKPTGGSLVRKIFRIYGSDFSYGQINFDSAGSITGDGVGYAEHSVETVNVGGTEWYRMYVAANISPGITTLVSTVYPSVFSPNNLAWSPEYTGEVITGPIAIRKRVTASTGFDWTAITASTVNFTGAIDGSPASQIRSGTANYRQDVSPTNDPSVPTITQSATADGNVVAKVAYTYSQGAIPADFVLIYAKEGGGTISPAVMSFATNAVSGDLSLVLKPSITYRFATQAVRRTETGIKGGNIISSADILLTSPNYTGLIAGSPATTVRDNANNAFTGTANYRQDVSPSSDPALLTIVQSATADGNIVVKVPFTYSPGSIPADFILIYTKEGGGTISPAVQAYPTNPVTGDMSFVLKPSITYRFAAQAVRRTESGLKGGNIISSADINLTSPNYTGLISGSPAAAIVLNANTAFSGTAKYRTAGAPTNLPVPTGIVSTPNSNATKTIRISWAAYLQGTNQADVIGIFYRRDNTIPTYIDTCVIMNVNLNTPGVFELTGVNPADPYSFGIAAGRRTENGIEWGEINTTYGTNPYYLYSASYPLINAPITGNGVTISPNTDYTPNGEITYKITDDSVNFESAVWGVSPSISNPTTERWMAEAWIKQETSTTKTALFRVYASNGSYGDLILNPTNGNIVSAGGPFNGEGFVETVLKDAVTWYRVGISSNISPNLTGIQAELYPTIGTIPSGAYSPDASGPGIVIGGVDVRKRTNSNAGFDWTAITADTVNFTGRINGSPAADIQSSALNYRTSNDQNGTTPTTPAIQTLTTIATDNASVNIKVPWTYSVTTGQTAGNIDGFIIWIYDSATSGAYTILGGSNPGSDETPYVVRRGSRQYIAKNLVPNRYYTFGVQAYRRVALNVDSSGILYSTISQTSPLQPAAVADFTGSIAGSPSTTVRDNARNAFDGTSEIRNVNVPTNNATIGSITSVATADGNSVITVPITYTQGAVNADGAIVYYKEGNTGANSPANDHKGFSLDSTDSSTARNLQFTLKPNQAYNFSVRAYRRAEGGRKYTAFSGVSTHTSTSSNYTGDLGGVPAATVIASNAVGGNLVTYSEALNSWTWENTGVGTDLNYLDKTTPFWKIYESDASVNVNHNIYSNTISVAIGETLTISAYVAAGERNTINLFLDTPPWGANNWPQAVFNLSTGVVNFSLGGISDAGIISVGTVGSTPVYRIYVTTSAATVATTTRAYLKIYNGGYSYTGTAGFGLYATRVQVTRGLLADYVKTTTTTIENTGKLSDSFFGTSKYRTAGAPTNLVIPTGITSTPNSNGTKTLKVTWAAYTQGTNQADVIGLFYRKDNNIPTYVDSCVVMNVNLNAPAYYELQGVNPADQYSFGIAAGRRTESGIEWGLINTTYGSNPWRLFENDVLTSRVPASGGAGVATSAFYTPNGELSYTLTDNNNTNFLSTYLSTGGISPTPSSERWMAETWIKQDTSSANTNILRLFSSNAPGFQYTDLALRYDNGVVTNFGSTWASSSAEYYVENHTLPDGQVWYKVGVSHLTSPGASDVYLEIYPAVGSPGVAYSAIATGSGTYGGFAIRKVRTASTGFDWTAVTADTVNFTGNIGGQTATSVAQTVTVGSGNNLIPNSDYRSAMTATNGYNPNGSTILAGIEYSSVNAPGWNGTYILNSETTQSLYIRQGSPVAGGDDAIGIDIYPYSTTPTAPAKIPVVANQKYCFSAYTQAHRAKTSVGIVYYDVSGSPLTYPESTSILGSGGFTSTLNNFNRQFVIATAPGSASYAIVYVRKWNTTAGNADSYMWYAAPQFERVNASVSSPGPYMPGPAITTGQLGYSGDLNATWGAPTGTLVGGSPAATVAANAVSGSTAFTGTISFRDGVAPNGTGASISATTGTATADGNVVVTVTYSYTNTGSRLADTYLIFVREGGGTVLSSDPCFASNPVSGTVQFTLKPSTSYTFGFSASRVTSSGNFATAITTSAGITTVAGNYTGNVNSVSSELISQTPVFEAYNPATFNFKNSTNGWTATNANLTANATYLAISPTAADPQLRRLNLSFSGAIYDKIRARIRRAGGTGVWEGVIFYGTSAGPTPHGESGSYFKVSSTVVANPNNWNVYEWDMANLNAGGTDWISSTIDRLRLDVSQDTNSNWEIDWITVGRTGIPTYGAEYGASPSNLIGLSGDGINRVVQRYAGGFNAVEFDNTQKNSNEGVLFPVTKGTGITYASVTAGNGLNGPTTGFYGSHSIKIVPGTGTRVAYFSTASNAYNMPLEPNSKWILSAKTWAASPSTFPTSMNLGVLTAVSPTTGYFVTHSIPAAQTWGNLSGILNLKNDSSTSGLLYTSIAGTTTQSVYLDGIMLEKKVGPGTTPTPWVKSSQTGISGTLKGTAVVNPTNLSVGTLLNGMGLNQGDGVARPVLSGLYVGYARDGDNITFPTAYSSTPTVVFLPGAKSTGSPVSVNQSTTYEAINLTPTGFTAKIKLTGLTSSVSPITDNVSTAGSPILSPGSPDSAGYTGNPAASYSINKTNSAEAWDDRYTFNYNVTINNIWTDTWEPGNATFGIYVRKTTGWYLVGTPTIFGGTGGSTTTKNVSSIAIVDGIIRNTAAGQNEFAIRILSSGGSLNSFTSVTYSVANAPTQQSATEATSAAVPFIVIANSGGT